MAMKMHMSDLSMWPLRRRRTLGGPKPVPSPSSPAPEPDAVPAKVPARLGGARARSPSPGTRSWTPSLDTPSPLLPRPGLRPRPCAPSPVRGLPKAERRPAPPMLSANRRECPPPSPSISSMSSLMSSSSSSSSSSSLPSSSRPSSAASAASAASMAMCSRCASSSSSSSWLPPRSASTSIASPVCREARPPRPEARRVAGPGCWSSPFGIALSCMPRRAREMGGACDCRAGALPPPPAPRPAADGAGAGGGGGGGMCRAMKSATAPTDARGSMRTEVPLGASRSPPLPPPPFPLAPPGPGPSTCELPPAETLWGPAGARRSLSGFVKRRKAKDAASPPV
mmetsp:Transcript_21607/g.58114  ORF Transcript_21607/g.58114 Transcript_21607/m.58114 type:complete len:340 (-) Transcript_21607:3638-4657(-)